MTAYTSDQTGPDYIASMPESEARSTIENYTGTSRKGLGLATEHPLSLYPSRVENGCLCRIAGTSIPEFEPLSIDPEDPNDKIELCAATCSGLVTANHVYWGQSTDVYERIAMNRTDAVDFTSWELSEVGSCGPR